MNDGMMTAAEEFIYAWRNVSDALQNIDRCLMFWSPNNAKTIDQISEWWPGSDYVQIVGVDLYVSTTTATFANQFGSFVSPSYFSFTPCPNSFRLLLCLQSIRALAVLTYRQ